MEEPKEESRADELEKMVEDEDHSQSSPTDDDEEPKGPSIVDGFRGGS